MVRNYKRKTSEPTKANACFNLPLDILSSHVLNTNIRNVGHLPALTIEQEQDLIKLFITLQEWEQLLTCNDILTYANELGKYWYYGFLKRWNNELKGMHSFSTTITTSQNESNHTQLGANLSNNGTDFTYKLLNEALDKSSIEKLITSSYETSFITKTMTSPTEKGNTSFSDVSSY
ncbi:unnamed protein product [Rotaria sordida]|uniref:Uncharacterized protein n=1 Tax=Rotaria sordida TaxID=392033 RepID=A0A819Q427_9BILA|nr:unnamed protein product [Rotaria sordida]